MLRFPSCRRQKIGFLDLSVDEFARNPPLFITVTRSASVRIVSGSVDSTRMATPLSRRVLRMRITSSLAPTSMPRVGSDRISTLGRWVSHLASATFCWLPPDSEPSSMFGLGGLICRSLARVAGDRAFRVGLEQQAVDAVEDGDRDVLVDRLRAEQHHAAVLRQIGDAGAPRRRGRPEATVLPSSSEAAMLERQFAEQRARQFDLAAAHEAVDAGDFAGAQLEREHRAATCRRWHGFDRQHDGLGIIAA